MSHLSKYLLVSLIVLFVLACNFVTQPVRDVQNLAGTAESIASSIPIQTLRALPSSIPMETLQALPSTIPTFEALASAMPDFENFFNPQGTPVQEWKGIPIMPQATVGQEFSENNTYSFKANITTKEVQDFYHEKLTALGWNQPFNMPNEGDTVILLFQKDSSLLTITVTSQEGSVVVILSLV